MTTYPFIHPDRYSLSKVVSKKLGVIIHTSESGDTTMNTLISLMSRPGDRPYTKTDGTTGYYGSSYHALADGVTGAYVELQPATHGPFSAPPLNKDYWHICMPGWSAQTREQWLDPMSRKQIQAVARYVVDKSKIDGFPAVKLTPEQVGLKQQGYASHADVTYGFKISGGHTDPGPNFPWDVLAQDIKDLLKPPIVVEEDMSRIVRIVDDAGTWVAPEQFVVTGGQIEWISNLERRNALIADGHATLNSVTGAPYKLNRKSLKNYRLIGPLSTGSIFNETEFLK